MKVRQIYQWPDGWVATELLDTEILGHAGQRMDVDIATWVPLIEAGHRAILLANPGGPLDRQILLREVHGSLEVAYHPGMAKVHKDIDLQRIEEMLDAVTPSPVSLEVPVGLTRDEVARRWRLGWRGTVSGKGPYLVDTWDATYGPLINARTLQGAKRIAKTESMRYAVRVRVILDGEVLATFTSGVER